MIFFPTADEDFQYFRSQGYTGSLNDMHYKAMGDLGYTGSLNDRIHAYLISEYGSFYEAMRDLRNGTSVFSLISYIVNGFDPALVFDFKGNYFRKSATDSTFGASITHAASSNATMVDSDGLLKWRPHNILTHSSDLTNAGWINKGLTVTTGQNDFEGNPTAFKITPTTASEFHRIYKSQVGSNLVNGTLSTVTIDLKADGYNFFSVATTSGRYAIINLSDGTVSLDTGSVSPTVTSLGNGWYRCSVTTSAVSQEVFSIGETSQANTFGSQTFTGDGTSGVLVAYPHSIRSDLGGMVNNPDTASSYVPTTSSVVYAPRRGHHIYNGSAWVNEGILHESEARTNQVIYSGDLTGTGWSGAGTTGTVTTGSPFGNYQTISPSANGSNLGAAQRYQIGKSITSGATYVGWALVKYSAGSGWFTVNMYDTGKANEQAYFDLQNGVVGSKESLIIDHGMVDYGDGWWLCWASSNAASGSGGVAYEMPNGDGVQSCSAADVILIAGTQFEAGSTPSSYIPTTSASATRAAETLTVPAANLPYNSTNMSIQINGKITYADNNSTNTAKAWRWRINNSNLIQNRITTSGSKTGEPQFVQGSTSSGIDSVVGGENVYSPNTNVPFNFAGRYGSTFINGAHEGTLLTANTTPTALPDLSSTDLELGNIFMGTIGQFRMWSDDLGDVGITEAST
jgi:hypothetical protein